MNELQVFNQWKMWRGWTLEFLKELPEEKWDLIPEHYTNNIRWNAGHILVGWDHTVCNHFKLERMLPLQYHLLFPRGSSPSEWKDEPPNASKLMEQLEQQPAKLIEISKGKLDTQLEEPFLHMTTLGEMFLFHISHEAMHLSVINKINQSTKKASPLK
ncbi:DinB family protein [Thalassobacillus devorans]|uniref:DinB family protein n=1 Tax=Thalassobacillus devorans TaxID=279813 RepID=UPI000A1CC73E|nr:DinB family protein [Thalassobacillus devorans]